jgi:formyltetrahydrofolate hydrolase
LKLKRNTNMESYKKIMAENTTAILNENLNEVSKTIFMPKKLEFAKAFIAKHGLPEGWDSNDSISISGIIKEVNADENTFVISVQSSDEKKNSKYLVVTIAEKLNDLVKKYWGDSLTISIKPVVSNGQAKQYELIEIQ